jgi:hypothetical protein
LTSTPFNDKTTVDVHEDIRTGKTAAGCDQYCEAFKPKRGITKKDVDPEAWTSRGDSSVWHPHPERP